MRGRYFFLTVMLFSPHKSIQGPKVPSFFPAKKNPASTGDDECRIIPVARESCMYFFIVSHSGWERDTGLEVDGTVIWVVRQQGQSIVFKLGQDHDKPLGQRIFSGGSSNTSGSEETGVRAESKQQQTSSKPLRTLGSRGESRGSILIPLCRATLWSMKLLSTPKPLSTERGNDWVRHKRVAWSCD